MRYLLKKNLTEAQARHRAFWGQEQVERPLVLAFADTGVLPLGWQSPLPRKEWDLDPAWHQHQAAEFLRTTEFVAEAMPLFNLMVGLDITNNAVLAGGDYYYGSGAECIGYHPGDFSLEQPIPIFDPHLPWVARLKTCYQAVCAQIGCGGGVSGTTTLDPLSSLYALSDPAEFLLEMGRGNPLIHQRRQELTRSYLAFYDYFFQLVQDSGYGETGSWLQMFVEGKFEGVRCDFSVMLSRELFREYVVPELVEICGHMDRTLFNMSSVEHIRFLDDLIGVERLDGVFWNPEPWRGRVDEHLARLAQIREAGLCLEIVCYTLEDALVAAKNLGGQGVALLLLERFPDAARARQALEEIAAACR